MKRVDILKATRFGVLGLLALSLSACAIPVNSIKPEVGRSNSFVQLSCNDLSKEEARIQTEMQELGNKQKKAVMQDVVSVFLIGIPTSKGGQNKEIAKVKADEQHVQSMLQARNCRPQEAAGT